LRHREVPSIDKVSISRVAQSIAVKVKLSSSYNTKIHSKKLIPGITFVDVTDFQGNDELGKEADQAVVAFFQ
jgi:hypothetical protein